MSEITVTATQLAEILGVSVGRVTQLHKGGMPRLPSKRYDVAEAVQYYIGKLRSAGPIRDQLLAAQREKTELQTELMRGTLTEEEDLVSFLMTGFSDVKSSLDAIPIRCNTDSKTEARIRDECNRTLEQLFQHFSNYQGIAQGGVGAETRTSRRRNRLGPREPGTRGRKPKTGAPRS